MKEQQLNVQHLKAVKISSAEDDIYREVEETIAEHKKVMQHWEEIFEQERAGIKVRVKDIYTEVEETIAEHKRVMACWEVIFGGESGRYYVMPQGQAA